MFVMYVGTMYACMHVRMHTTYMYACTHVHIHACIYACRHAWMYVVLSDVTDVLLGYVALIKYMHSMSVNRMWCPVVWCIHLQHSCPLFYKTPVHFLCKTTIFCCGALPVSRSRVLPALDISSTALGTRSPLSAYWLRFVTPSFCNGLLGLQWPEWSRMGIQIHHGPRESFQWYTSYQSCVDHMVLAGTLERPMSNFHSRVASIWSASFCWAKPSDETRVVNSLSPVNVETSCVEQKNSASKQFGIDRHEQFQTLAGRFKSCLQP